MRWRSLPLLLLLIGAAPSPVTPAGAPPQTVVSDTVGKVSVTVYRDPNRGEGAMNRRWPGGYALISEERSFDIPAGDSVIRFEGVAEGLLPETAIVTGLPREVREKNRDARLLSPAGLVDAYLKRRVHLVRTNRKTGKVTQQDAIIQAGPDGGVLLQTDEGVEALGCSGLPERMRYDAVPADLSPRPTLSVLASSERAMTVKVRLTYLAEGFDWGASYVARTHEADDKVGLFAWLTVANGGSQGFENADLKVVAGRPNKESNAPRLVPRNPELRLRCWPMDITSTHPRYEFEQLPWDLDDDGAFDADGDNIVVTASRETRYAALAAPPPPPPSPPPPPVVAAQEDLGDLKLYRVPIPVTLAAQSQKQVTMIDKGAAEFDWIYSAGATMIGANPTSSSLILRTKNVDKRGLGLPLPSGGLTLFAPRAGTDLLIGESSVRDHAVGEEFEIRVGGSPDVQWQLVPTATHKKRIAWRATITNALPTPIRAELAVPGWLLKRPPGTERGPGGWRLPVTVAANGTATIDYAVDPTR